jgi:hypothetical protein
VCRPTVSHMTRRFLRQRGHSLNPLIGQHGGGCTTSHHMSLIHRSTRIRPSSPRMRNNSIEESSCARPPLRNNGQSVPGGATSCARRYQPCSSAKERKRAEPDLVDARSSERGARTTSRHGFRPKQRCCAFLRCVPPLQIHNGGCERHWRVSLRMSCARARAFPFLSVRCSPPRGERRTDAQNVTEDEIVLFHLG